MGADLANIINEAALLAARNEKEMVELIDFDEAILSVKETVQGDELRKMMSEKIIK